MEFSLIITLEPVGPQTQNTRGVGVELRDLMMFRVKVKYLADNLTSSSFEIENSAKK